MTKKLSYKTKRDLLSLLILRDDGLFCFFCRTQLTIRNLIYEHLNCDDTDNRPENIVLSCQSCNVKKKNDSELQIFALEKLHRNEIKAITENKKIEDTTFHRTSTEIAINQSNSEITWQYLSERIGTDGSIEFSKAINSCAYLCRQKTRFGSQQAIRNYIDLLTCDEGPFMVVRDDNKKKIIVRRCN